MKQGIDALVRSAIRGHGGMPARGGQAKLTDTELRSAILYMFNPAAMAAAATRRAAPPPAGAAKKTVGGVSIYLGFVAAESLLTFPADSVERTMHGGVPRGAGYYHMNVSLFDGAGNVPISDARIEARIERPGLGGDSKSLEPIAIGPSSYGAYVKVLQKTPYQIFVRVRRPGSPGPVEARFEHRF